MAPELREWFKRSVRGTPEPPGIISVIEKLKRRTQIDPATLELQVDKRPYPWKVGVKGVREIVGDKAPGESFELEATRSSDRRSRTFIGRPPNLGRSLARAAGHFLCAR